MGYQLDTSNLRGMLLYGTLTRDDAGDFYLVGRAREDGGKSFEPLVLVIPVESLWPVQ